MVALFTTAVFFYRQSRYQSLQTLEQLEDRVQRMERLITARQTYREVIYTERKLLLSDKRVLFSLIFTVEAGFKLENCRVEKQSDGGVIVYLPPVEILSIDADETSIKQYFAKEQFSMIRFSDFSSVIEKEKERILEEARLSGLKNRALSNGINTITSLFRLAGIDNVTVKISEILKLEKSGGNRL